MTTLNSLQGILRLGGLRRGAEKRLALSVVSHYLVQHRQMETHFARRIEAEAAAILMSAECEAVGSPRTCVFVNFA